MPREGAKKNRKQKTEKRKRRQYIYIWKVNPNAQYVCAIRTDYRVVIVNWLLPCGVIVTLSHWRRLRSGFESR